MRGYEIERHLSAPPERVWQMLTDAERLASGRTGILSLKGRIATGERIVLRSEVQPKRDFVLAVTHMDPPREMVWSGGSALFAGTRRFTLTPVDGGTRLHLSERFTGLLAPILFRLIPDLRPSMERFASGLSEMTS